MIGADHRSQRPAQPTVDGDVILGVDLVPRRVREHVARRNRLVDKVARADEKTAALVRRVLHGVSADCR
jgi:hypothetical protein